MGLGAGGMGVHVGGTCPLISFSQHLLFDITVSHLSLTRSERESREEGPTMRERERERDRQRGAMRGAEGSEEGREGGEGWGGVGSKLKGLTG